MAFRGSLFYKERVKHLLLFSSLLFFSSCSKLSTGVYWADTFATSYADDYFTFDSEQKENFKREFQASFLEVRKNEFPRIADILEGIAGEVEAGKLKEEGLEQWQAKTKHVLETAARRFEPLGQSTVARQAEQGFAKFDQELASRFAKQGERLSTPEGMLKQARRRIERVIDETVEALTKDQEAVVEAALKENPLRLELESRQFIFEQFRAARSQASTRAAFVRNYFYEWDSLQRQDYLKARDAYQKKSRSLMLKVIGSATDEQKRNLIESFRDRAAEFRKLAVVGR